MGQIYVILRQFGKFYFFIPLESYRFIASLIQTPIIGSLKSGEMIQMKGNS